LSLSVIFKLYFMARGRGQIDTPEEDKKRKLNKEGIGKIVQIFSFLKPYKGLFITGLVALAASRLTALAFPKLIGEVINVIDKKSNYTVNQIVVFLFIVLAMQALFSFLRVFIFSRLSENTMADIRKSVYAKIVSLPIVFFEKRRVGELTSRIASDVTQLQDVLAFTLAEFFGQVVTLVGGLVYIVYTAPKLTLFMLLTFPVLVVAAMVFGRFIRKMSKKAQDNLAEANVVVEETLQNIPAVKAFTNETFEVNRYDTSLRSVIQAALKAATFRGAFISFSIFALFGGIVGVVWYGASLVQSGEMAIGDLLTFTFLTMFIGGSVAGMGEVYSQIQKAIGSSERLLEILDEESEVNLTQQPDFKKLKGEIAFDSVAFSYPTRSDVTVLDSIDFKVNAGEKIALVGQSGAGKSTIAQLLMRFHTPTHGQVLIDNQVVNDFNITNLRQNIAIVPQEVMLFGGTIRDNIAYGKPNATTQEIEDAARKANALEFINSFPEGLATIVGERGVKLSGGQRQRVAIARAILKDPSILILDEATSALDSESEKLVQEALDELMKGRTTVIIAHRLATIRNVDKIYVLRDGQIAESGSHDELIQNQDGIYANLVRLQVDVMALEEG
jgi:ATP-binding cassette, subfamily B, bacterial